MNRGDYKKIYKEILSHATMSDIEYRRLYNYVDDIRRNIISELEDLLDDPEKDVFLGGSFPRRTFLRYDFDADIFIRFPEEYSREDLEKIVFNIANKLFGKDRVRKRFAEHPYAEVILENIIINIVPSYKVSPPNWKSPVDRSFYHAKYLEKYLSHSLVNEVILLKSFLKGINCYGAEIRIKGFSGYLSELMIVHYKSFDNIIKDVLKWRHPPVIIDIENHYRSKEEIIDMFPKSHFIVIDPVDKGRNVASALDKRNFARFISATKSFSLRPRKIFFYPYSDDFQKNYFTRLEIDNIKNLPILLIILRHGEKIEDIYYSQLESLARKIATQIKLNEIKVLKIGVYSDFKETSLILFFLSTIYFPTYHLKLGPPTYYSSEKDFLEKNIKEKISWISNDLRWHILRKYNYVDVKSFVLEILNKKQIKIPSELREDNITISYINELDDQFISSIKEWITEFIIGEDYWRVLY